MTTTDPRTRALELALQNMERRFGKGAVMRLGDGPDTKVETFSTGCESLDLALGVGGYPRGRVIEVFGPESSGKTTLTLHAIAQMQAQGGTCAFIDAEHALDPAYAAKLGVDLNDLLVAQPDSGEQALEICECLLRSGAVDLIVVDSVAALVPKAELDGEMGDHHVGLHARLMSQAMRKLTGVTGQTGATVMFINQIRHKIGVMFGNGEVTTGGNALKFYSTVRLEIRRIGAIKQGDQVLGNRTRIKVVKNKLAAPFRSVETEIRFGVGICPASDLLLMGEKFGVMTKAGSWFSLGETRLGQGREAARDRLLEDPELLAKLRGLVRGAAGLCDQPADA